MELDKFVYYLSYTVNAVDSSPPTINGCPQSSTYTVSIGTPSRIVIWTEPTATDDSGVAPTVVSTHRPGESFPVGTTVVTYIFADQEGNDATCSFTIMGNYQHYVIAA